MPTRLANRIHFTYYESMGSRRYMYLNLLVNLLANLLALLQILIILDLKQQMPLPIFSNPRFAATNVLNEGFP